ncbi:MAG: sigma-70 family RNA polymerase sigma factor [Acidobacteriota bacterium]
MSQRQLQRVKGKMPGARASLDELAERHLHLVHHIARDFQNRLPQAVSFDDLVGAGNLGLVEAALRFDPSRGASFGAFARHRIRGAVTDSLRGLDPISRYRRSQWRAAERAVVALSTKLGREPSDREIAWHLKVPERQWRVLCRELYEAGCSIDVGRWPSAAPVPAERLPSSWPDPERLAATAELRAAVTDAMQTLPPRYRKVVALYHFAGWTMKRIGAQLGVNESRVSQIHAGAMQRLRELPELRKRA